MQIHFAIMRLRPNRFWNWLCVACVAFCMVACGDDDDEGSHIPSYITDFMLVSTDAKGYITTVTLDDGSIYPVTTQKRMTDYPDTTLRCRANYTLDEGQLRLYGVGKVFAQKPVPASAFRLILNGVSYDGEEYIPRDPVKVVSMWKSGGYINLHLGLMTTGNGVHQYAFCEDSPGHYSLVHLRPYADAESYTEQIFMSMPIPEGMEELTFSVYTYDGIYTRTF